MANLPFPPTAPASVPPDAVERWARALGMDALIGADEVGRGPLAGPVVGAAVRLPPGVVLPGVTDSKALSAAERERLAHDIRRVALAWAVVELPADEIDRTNIRAASLRAMGEAVMAVVRAAGVPALVAVDGRDTLPVACPQRAVVRGDQTSVTIAAASILAKVYRDRVMTAYAACFPAYGFECHKGYGTAAHRAAIARHGPCPLHRRTFRLTPAAA